MDESGEVVEKALKYTDDDVRFAKQSGNVVESISVNIKYVHDTKRALIASARERTIVTFFKADNGIASFKEAMQKHVKVLENLP